EQYEPYDLRAERAITDELDTLLRAFVADGRMRLADHEYIPCYRLVK
ncbi:MAG: pyrimidine/purine nucleotide monophosphate nucleosidase domain-containing protein, partial [Gammaproteobacteria bacterium]